MSHPYRSLPAHCFWSEAVTWPHAGAIDPVTRAERIDASHKVATIGSCFAQHLSREIRAAGLNFFQPEAPAPFSARYGNVYTVRQALQLLERAFGRFRPQEDVWERAGRFVDAFRPRLEPQGFDTPEAVRAEAARHLEAVKRVFAEADWLVFTLGLTEAWRARADGAVYPLAPGVAGGEFDPARHEFVNFGAAETIRDLEAFVQALREVNPRLRLLLTVSPVALAATYEKRHVLASSTASKAVLRAAADEMERRHANVIYFPSYEIITSPAAGGRYYADDLRQVNALGVSQVMRVFRRHFVDAAAARPAASQLAAASGSGAEVECDEEEILLALKRSL